MRLQQMCDSEPGAQRGAVTAIKREKFVDGPVTQHMLHPAPQIVSSPGRSEPLAFEAEKGNFIERIDDTKARIEFEAVDDPDLVVEPNVLWPQIAMPIHDPAMTQACHDAIAAPLQKPALCQVNTMHDSARNSEPRVEQNALIVRKALGPIGKIDC